MKSSACNEALVSRLEINLKITAVVAALMDITLATIKSPELLS